MSIEKEPRQEKTFKEIEQEMHEQGYLYAGIESLTITRLDEKDSRFKAFPSQTREQIIEKHSSDGRLEVELIDIPNRIPGPQDQEAVWVFVKEKEKN
ncbi:MAG: hypothetical protein WC242_03950 [Candidatus Paceibacterota bacterium]|jgi:hypothetical protein